MILALLTFLSAVSISFTAAYFSIIGLAAIFAATAIPVIIMGSVLEVGKLVAATWLHHNWKNSSVSYLIKGYLFVAIIVLMIITALGIYGFLAKGHLEQEIPIQQNQEKIVLIDKKIEIEKTKIRNYQKQIENISSRTDNNNDEIDQLNQRLENLEEKSKELISQSQQISNQIASLVDGLFSSKKKQREALRNQLELIKQELKKIELEKERVNQEKESIRENKQQENTGIENVEDKIQNSHLKIEELSEQKAEIQHLLVTSQIKLGPVKYVSDLFQIEDPNAAIRIVILLIMFAFDPLAVILVISSSISFKENFQGKKFNRINNDIKNPKNSQQKNKISQPANAEKQKENNQKIDSKQQPKKSWTRS